MKKLLSILTLLVVAVTGAWADATYYMVDRTGDTPTLTSDFRVEQNLVLDGSNNPIVFEGNSLLGYVRNSGTQSAITGTVDFKKHFAYDVKSTATKIKLYVYNTNNSEKKLYISEVKEGETSESHITTKNVASKTATILEYETTNTKNSTIFFYVNSTNIQYYQIEAVESGTPLPTAGEPGYELNFNKGRACAKSNTLAKLDGIELLLNSDYKPCSNTEARIKSKGTQYIKFTTTVATEVSVNVSTDKTYYISSTIDASEAGVSSYTANATKIIPAGTWYIVPNESEVKVTKLSFAASGLSIKTQPVSAEYILNATATPLTVVAQGGTEPYTYQWYSCSDAEKTNPQAVGTNSASYTPSTAATGYYYCKVTDSATPTPASVESDVATITISAAAAPTFTSVTPSATNVVRGTASTITAVVEGNPDPTVTWYSCDDAEKTNPVEAGTGLVLNLTNDAMGTFYYYAVATNGVSPDAESAVQTITVTGKKDCELTNIKFSNGAYGAIGTLSEGAATVTVPYLDGESEPTINESSIVISSDATYAIVGDVLTVTAEDGITKGVYTITKSAIPPLTVTGDIATTIFDAVPIWAFNPYGFDAEKGVKIAKKVDEASNRRIAKGNTRMYFFIGPAVKLTLTSGSTGARDIKVYRNGVQLAKPTKSAAENESIDIELNATAPCMIMIESNQTGGDTGFTKYAVTAVSKVEVTSAEWATTTTPNYPVTFDANAKVYVVTSAESSIQLTQITEAPANTPVVVNAPTGSYTMTPKSEAAAIETNMLKSKTANDETAAVGDYALGTWIDGGNTVVGFGKLNAAGVANMTDDKAFIPASLLANAVDFLPFVIGDEENETTSIKAVETAEVSGTVYNLAGQKVGKDYKGIVIVNGKKFVRK